MARPLAGRLCLFLTLIAPMGQAHTWFQVTASNAPDQRSQHSAAMDSSNRLWVFGGHDSSSHFDDLRYIDTQGAQTWIQVESSNAPNARRGHSTVMDSTDRMWIFGGWTDFQYATALNELYYFDTQVQGWTLVSASNAPEARALHSAAMDSSNRMWIFGGIDYNGAYLNDLYYFDTQVQSWTQVSASNAPEARFSHVAAMDSSNRMWIHGGDTDRTDTGPARAGFLNDLYYLDTQDAQTWVQVAVGNAPDRRCMHAAAMDSLDRMWFFGGYVELDVDPYLISGTDELHYFDTQAQSWTQVTADNAPAGRYQLPTAVDSSKRLWIFGGSGSFGYANDLYYFDTQTTTTTMTGTSSSITTSTSQTTTTTSTATSSSTITSTSETTSSTSTATSSSSLTSTSLTTATSSTSQTTISTSSATSSSTVTSTSQTTTTSSTQTVSSTTTHAESPGSFDRSFLFVNSGMWTLAILVGYMAMFLVPYIVIRGVRDDPGAATRPVDRE